MDQVVETLQPQETVSKLKQPFLVLVQEQDPHLFTYDQGKPVNADTGEEMHLPSEITPQIAKKLTQLVYEPYLLAPTGGLHDEFLSSNLKEGMKLEFTGHFGYFFVYRFVPSDPNSPQKHLLFNNRQDALKGISRAMEDTGLNYKTAEVDHRPETPDEEKKKIFRGLKPKERKELQSYYQHLLDQEFLSPLKETATIPTYLQTMLKSLESIREEIFTSTSNGNTSDPKWIFCQDNITPLIDYLEHRVKHQKQSQIQNEDNKDNNLDTLETVIEAAFDYEAVLLAIKQQSELLISRQLEHTHQGFLIPINQLEGARVNGSTIFLTDSKLVIHSPQGTFKYPLPSKTNEGEVAIKGGLARLVTKVVLNQPIDDELPPSDIDLVTFGSSSRKKRIDNLKKTYNVEAKDIEWISKTGSSGYREYLTNRDQAINEVLLTSDGLVVSLNALSSYFQNSTEAAAQPYKSLYGAHVLNVELDYLREGGGQTDTFFVRNTRFPTQKTLSRMYRSLIEDKAQAAIVPQGSLKKDIGLYWLVTARKFLSIKDPQRREYLLNRMVELANVVDSPHYQEGISPQGFIKNIRNNVPGGKDFDLNGKELSDKETLNWLAKKLIHQLLNKLRQFSGYDPIKALEKKLKPSDLQPTQILLPKPEAYPGPPEGEGEGKYIPHPKKQEKIDYKKRSQELKMAFFEAFSATPPPGSKQFQQRILAFLEEKGIPTAKDFETCRTFYIPPAAKDRFYTAGDRILAFIDPHRGDGLYNAKDHLLYVITPTNEELSIEKQKILFEELFHSTGRHQIKDNNKLIYSPGFINTLDESRGNFFEEGLAGLAYSEFSSRDQINMNTLSSSDIAGYTLNKIISSLPNRQDILYYLFQARIGVPSAEIKAQQAIDQKYGAGFFTRLMKMNIFQMRDWERLYNKLGLEIFFAM